jgi:hypothetical protein
MLTGFSGVAAEREELAARAADARARDLIIGLAPL